MNVGLISSNKLVRYMLLQVFTGSDYKITASCSSFENGMQAIATADFVVLTDENRENISKIRISCPEKKILLFTQRDDPGNVKAQADFCVRLPESDRIQEQVVLAKRAIDNLRLTHHNSIEHSARDIIKKKLDFSNTLAVVIGCSSGGPDALSNLLSEIKKILRVPILIVQHISAEFTSNFADQIRKISPMPVEIGIDNMSVHSGCIYLAPGGSHMMVETRDRIRLDDGPMVNYCKPSVDVLFNSVANVYSNQLLGIILSGMGCDGVGGCSNIKQNGGTVIVQDKETSLVWGMPGVVATKGLADDVMAASEIGKLLNDNF